MEYSAEIEIKEDCVYYEGEFVGPLFISPQTNCSRELFTQILNLSAELIYLHLQDEGTYSLGHISKSLSEKIREDCGERWQIIIGKSFGAFISQEVQKLACFKIDAIIVLTYVYG
eukprot:snap_masked-scaffold_5-processed-gene-8.32-mRNA-1 protein AED:1.00 eAED:1.00 QI:0/-1/0/0/-1/1/1/0/114